MEEGEEMAGQCWEREKDRGWEEKEASQPSPLAPPQKILDPLLEGNERDHMEAGL